MADIYSNTTGYARPNYLFTALSWTQINPDIEIDPVTQYLAGIAPVLASIFDLLPRSNNLPGGVLTRALRFE